MDGLTLMFKEIKYIQDSIINYIICNNLNKNYKALDELIDDTIDETIYRIMEFFDGFSNIKIHYLIKNINSGIIINDNIFDLHNKWYNYINNHQCKTNTDIDILFFELKGVRNNISILMKSNKEKYNNDCYAIVLSITLKIIYNFFLIIDGYNINKIKYDILDSQNKTISDNNMLHLNTLNYLL